MQESWQIPRGEQVYGRREGFGITVTARGTEHFLFFLLGAPRSSPDHLSRARISSHLMYLETFHISEVFSSPRLNNFNPFRRPSLLSSFAVMFTSGKLMSSSGLGVSSLLKVKMTGVGSVLRLDNTLKKN